MTTLFTQSRTDGKIVVVIDADAAYVESAAGTVLTADVLRQIADEIDVPARPGD